MTAKIKKILVNDFQISIDRNKDEDYISLTDMANAKDGENRAADIIKNWIRNRGTIEFLGTWEMLNNPNFKVVEFDHFRKEAGLPTFVLSVSQWVEQTGAIGIMSKLGKYGGTYAHKDIAFEFGSAISPVFKLYLIKEYQRLKEVESNQFNLEWDVKRILTKANYSIHTDAIKNHILPSLNISKDKEWITYAEEADVLNVALFGCTAKQWKQANPQLALDGKNMRDFASINELTVLSNLEVLNSELIKNKLPKLQRFQYLHKMAIQQKAVLDDNSSMKALKKMSDDTFLNEGKRLND
ncbi:KilA-N domain-containing protein [Flavobacterium sp.]|jgi:KilA-N domain|uniref:KilA-N domain-containing protein n=1 Tax=Flavobacterium sp. TaxID=239 RepID=UPI0022CCC42C|nr:KilA-N domain-containing protein [Flavobacterium sp.]MCZ8091198.1 KilA-N domain-containing protein [Flavobacterium sp.]